ncbi:MAG: hypothetical protein K9G29_06020 [Crocinitomicaceae bacterium]|nr:hypothetical protein [Crocinitomicaceae bacterium]
MKFYLSQRADKEIEDLAKKPHTKNIRQDICSFFTELKTIENMRNVDETLGVRGKNTTIKKTRVTNSVIKEKKGGYRLYFIVSELKEVVIISSVYSKKTTTNYGKEEIKLVFKTANVDIKNGLIQLVDINKELKKLA